jgi:hypothetical protein
MTEGLVRPLECMGERFRVRWWTWVIFGVVQCAGFTLVDIDHGPCGGLFSLPGLIL